MIERLKRLGRLAKSLDVIRLPGARAVVPRERLAIGTASRPIRGVHLDRRSLYVNKTDGANAEGLEISAPFGEDAVVRTYKRGSGNLIGLAIGDLDFPPSGEMPENPYDVANAFRLLPLVAAEGQTEAQRLSLAQTQRVQANARVTTHVATGSRITKFYSSNRYFGIVFPAAFPPVQPALSGATWRIAALLFDRQAGANSPNVALVTTGELTAEERRSLWIDVLAGTGDLSLGTATAVTLRGPDFPANDIVGRLITGASARRVFGQNLYDSGDYFKYLYRPRDLSSADLDTLAGAAAQRINIQTGYFLEAEIDLPEMSFAATSSSTPREATTVNVTINASAAVPSGFWLNYDLRGTATRGTDYTITGASSTGGQVFVPKGTRSISIPVKILGGAPGPDKTIILSVAEGSGYAVASARATHILIIEGRAGVSFSEDEQDVTEGAGTRNVRVNIAPRASSAFTLRYSLSGTAERGKDYTIAGVASANGTVAVSKGASSVDIPVKIIDDAVREDPAETIIITLTAHSDYELGTQKTHTITILPSDSPSFFRFASSEDFEWPFSHLTSARIRITGGGGAAGRIGASGAAGRASSVTYDGATHTAAGGKGGSAGVAARYGTIPARTTVFSSVSDVSGGNVSCSPGSLGELRLTWVCTRITPASTYLISGGVAPGAGSPGETKTVTVNNIGQGDVFNITVGAGSPVGSVEIEPFEPE